MALLSDRTRWEEIRRLFAEAMAVGAAQRDAVLTASSSDPGVIRDVRTLLEAHDRAATFLESPLCRDLAIEIDADAGSDPDRDPASASDSDPLSDQGVWIGRRLGAYRIVQAIGRGGMGCVFLAERADSLFEKQVAIKIARLDKNAASLVDRFGHERQILAGLDHPNIARLLDAGSTDDGFPFVVMEYVDGLPIDQYCDVNELDVRGRLELFQKVCATVQAAHDRAVVHRDLKAGNILVTREGIPKLLDFGIAKSLHAENGTADLTQTSHRVLTLMSAAPEQLYGGPITGGTDVYALGVLLYELITGDHPFAARAETPLQLEQAILHADPQPPSVVNAARGVDNGLDARTARAVDTIALTALRKPPELRYESAHALAADLQRVLDGMRPVGVRKGGVSRLLTDGYRHWWVAAGCAAAALAVAVVAWSFVDTGPAVRSPASPTVQTVAIRPFRDLNATDSESKLGWGMADALVTRLNAVNGLRVRAIDGSRDPSVEQNREIASRPDIVIDGTIQRSGSRIRVMARLIDPQTGLAMWSTTSEDEASEFFAIEDRLSLEIVRRVFPRFDGSGLRARSATSNEQAYNAYVQGRYYLNLGSPDAVRKALWHFEQAVAEDPSFAAGHAGLAAAYAWLRDLSPLTPPNQSARGRAAAVQALAIEPSLGEAHAALGVFTLIDDWNWTTAEQEFRRAIELNPRDDMAVIWYAAGLAAHKRFDEALEHLRRAEARDPFSRPLRNQLVRVLYMARRFDEARGECEQILKEEPSFRMSFCGLARVQSDAIAEGLADLEVLVRSSPRAGNLSALGYAYGRAGRTADAIRVVRQIALQMEEAGCIAYYSAEVTAGLNDREGTLARLERARQLRCPTLMLRIQVDPKFDALTADERARLATPPRAN